MRHQKKKHLLNMSGGRRVSVLNSLVQQLVIHEKLETTDARARILVSLADKMVTIGKEDTVHARRKAYRVLKNRKLVQKLFDDIAPRFAKRNGGYTRMMYKGFRAGDGAKVAVVEFVEKAAPVAVAAEAKDK